MFNTPQSTWKTYLRLCFLSEVSKKAESVAPQTTTHTIIYSQKDVTVISKRLIESAITTLDSE